MGWPKGKKREPKNKLEIVGVESPVDEPAEMPDTIESNDVQDMNIEGDVATQDTWRYHATLEPRIFKAGQVIPEGWTEDHTKWRRSQIGSWEKVA
jgi:hypothetical protein